METRDTNRSDYVNGVALFCMNWQELRKLTFGSTIHHMSKEWQKAGFHFHFHETPYPYGLVAEKVRTLSIISYTAVKREGDFKTFELSLEQAV